mmetsp:Transcript_31213/g.99834  ORF Transcript_31213/g.99834 Transcript_31213/m.99834 type:complete len:127 (-) Transcript_31213:412-792(-)
MAPLTANGFALHHANDTCPLCRKDLLISRYLFPRTVLPSHGTQPTQAATPTQPAQHGQPNPNFFFETPFLRAFEASVKVAAHSFCCFLFVFVILTWTFLIVIACGYMASAIYVAMRAGCELRFAIA